MYNDLVSIIVPVYNSEKFLEEAIKSILEQTYKNWELILINDASTDESINIIKKFAKEDKRITYIELEKNSGTAVARNKGIEKATGKYIAFLDSDDWWEKEKLYKQVDFMKQNNCGFSFTAFQYAIKDGREKGTKVFVPQKLNYKQALKNTLISTITVMFDMDIINKDLIYMTNVKSEDTATWWKILKKGYTAYGINEILSYYRRHKNSKSSNKLVAIKQAWELYRKVEKMNLFSSMYYFCFYAVNAVKRRI